MTDPTGLSRSGRPESLSLWGQVRIFVEHLGPDFAMLPAHEMHGRLRLAGRELDLTASVDTPSSPSPLPPSSRHGIEARHDGVLVTGPGAIVARLRGALPLDLKAAAAEAAMLEIDVSFAVSGATVPVSVGASLRRQPGQEREYALQQILGRFEWVAEGHDVQTQAL